MTAGSSWVWSCRRVPVPLPVTPGAPPVAWSSAMSRTSRRSRKHGVSRPPPRPSRAGSTTPPSWVRISVHRPDPDWVRRLIRVNIEGTYWGCSEAVQGFLEHGDGGSIVSISSLHARAAFPRWAAYESSKGAIESLTRNVAVEYGPLGIRANAVAPGAIGHPGTRTPSPPHRTLPRHRRSSRHMRCWAGLGRPRRSPLSWHSCCPMRHRS